MNFFKDRSTPFLSIAQALLLQKEQQKKREEPQQQQQQQNDEKENIPHQRDEQCETSSSTLKQEITITPKPENIDQRLQATSSSNVNVTINNSNKKSTSSSKEESIERENDDDEMVSDSENFVHPLSKNINDNVPPLHLKRFDIKGLNQFPLSDEEVKKKQLLLNYNDTGVGVGTTDDPFRLRLAELVRQKNCILGHHSSPKNDTEAAEREILMKDLTTLRESLHVLQQMMNCGVDVYSACPETLHSKSDNAVPSAKNNNNNDVTKLDVFQINIAPPPPATGKLVSSTSTEEEVRQLMRNSNNKVPVPYSKFYGPR